MGLRFKGPTPRHVAAELEKDANTFVAEMRKIWLEGAVRIVEQSKKYAPVDKHNLEESHTLELTKTTATNFTVSIDVGGVVNGVNVDEYAWIMHDSVYNLGRKSRAKDGGRGVVGRLFLERAANELVPVIEQELKDHYLATMRRG